jgi:hypothetical protein
MQPAPLHRPVSKTTLWIGRILGGVAVLFLLFDAVIHLTKPAPVAAAFAELGYPVGLAVGLGILELVCLIVYLLPQTSVLGAILLTGYLGGAVASNLRVGHSLFEDVFPVLVGGLVWAGLYVREDRLRVLVPLRRQ